MATSGAPVWLKNGAKNDLGLTRNPRRVQKIAAESDSFLSQYLNLNHQQNLTVEQTKQQWLENKLIAETCLGGKGTKLDLVQTRNNCNRRELKQGQGKGIEDWRYVFTQYSDIRMAIGFDISELTFGFNGQNVRTTKPVD